MAKKRPKFYLVMLNRLAAWLLLVVMIIYIFSGFALCGTLGFNRWIATDRALAVHRNLAWPLVVLFLVHAGISVYFALRRWGWVKTRGKS